MKNAHIPSLSYHSHQACISLFDKLFPNGLIDLEVQQTLAPQGWAQSPLVYAFHPQIEQVLNEALRQHYALEDIINKRNPIAKKRRVPTLKSVQKSYQPKPIKPEEEIEYLIGLCLWDIFSNEHDVIQDRKAYHLGSWRGTGSFISEYLSIKGDNQSYSYMDFYMGSWQVSGRCDLTPVYRILFQRLRQQGCDWLYNSDYITGTAYLPEAEWVVNESDTQKLVAIIQNEIGVLPAPIILAYLTVYGKIPTGYLEGIKG